MPGKRLPEEERREEILRGAYRVAVRDHLGGLSMRAVAEEAGVSKGLVFFHFDDKETLLRALLEWLVERGPRVDVPPELAGSGGIPAQRLIALVQHQVAALPERREWVELFLDFWVMGKSSPGMQERIRDAFARYRQEFMPFTEPVVRAHPERFDAGGARGLAAAAVSFIQGCSLQLMADPEHFDVDRYMRAVRGLVMAGPAETRGERPPAE